MKRTYHALAALAAFSLSTLLSADAAWTYDASAKTLTSANGTVVLNNVFVGSIIISDLAGIHPDIRQVADFHAVAAGQNNRAQHHERSQNRTNLFPN